MIKQKLFHWLCLGSVFYGMAGWSEIQWGARSYKDYTDPDKPKDPAYYAEKPDFAYLEGKMPIKRRDLDQLTWQEIAKLDQEQLDELYARLSSGPIPVGEYKGEVPVVKGGMIDRMARMSNQPVGVLMKLFLGDSSAGTDVKALTKAPEKPEEKKENGDADKLPVDPAQLLRNSPIGSLLGLFWNGKTFIKSGTAKNNRTDILVNRINVRDPQVQAILRTVGPQLGMVGAENVPVEKNGFANLFPAKIYCGQSLLDSRRESIIIDYAYTEDLTEYFHKGIDEVADRNKFAVRDEIRMVKPGLYLGRAYLNRAFVLNFILHNEEVNDGNLKDDCWVGTQDMQRD